MVNNRVRRVNRRDCCYGRLHAVAGCVVVDDETFEFSFAASVDKVQTLADGGIKVSLLLSETAIPQAALFMECKRNEKALRVSCKTAENSLATMERKSQRVSPKNSDE